LIAIHQYDGESQAQTALTADHGGRIN
jgi:hypothetical protein